MKGARVLRIIAGSAKGRRLFSPKSRDIRPTTDRVKESVFNMISNYIENAVVIDLFTGTGNLGIEALSRGAEKAYFCDCSRESLELAKKNIELCQFNEKSTVIHANYENALNFIKDKADVIFLDPPYNSGIVQACICKIIELGLLNPDGIIVAEHSISEQLPDYEPDLVVIKKKKYGAIMITIYNHQYMEEIS